MENYSTVFPRISARALTKNFGRKGGRLLEGGRLIEGGAYYVLLYDSRSYWPSKAGEWSSCAWEVYGIYTKRAAIGQKLKEKIMHIKELCKHMEMETTINDLTEKKLFSYMYSDASAVGA